MSIKPSHGGPRSGAGRPKKDYKTVTVSFRVKEGYAAHIKELVKKAIEALEKKAAESLQRPPSS
jgi:hypothetical protein